MAQLEAAAIIPYLSDNGLQADFLLRQAVKEHRTYDAVVLDLTLPGMDGMDVLAGMRRRKDMTPVMVLTARSTLADKVGGFDNGADDYLAKPFEPEELIVRLRAITRRAEGARDTMPCLANLAYDASNGHFLVEGSVLTLPPRIHGFLEVLFRRRGSAVSRSYLADLYDDSVPLTAVDTQIYRLRKRLLDAGAEVKITTHRGTGFVLEAGVS